MRVHRILGAGLVTAIMFAACQEAPQPTAPPGDALLARAGAACSVSDDPATQVRTVSGNCGNQATSVPDGWTLNVSGSSGGSGAMSVSPMFTGIPNPDPAYVAATNLIDISGLADFSNHNSVTDGTVTASFSTPLQKRSVPASWGTWGDPPFVEPGTPHILWTQGVQSLTVTFSEPVGIAGFELGANPFALHTFTAQFFSGATLVGTIQREIHGDNGARLIAANGDGQTFTHVVVTGTADFAIGRIRYDTGTQQPPIEVPVHDVYSGLPRQDPGVISLDDDWVFAEILNIQQYLPQPGATPNDVRLGASFETGTPAESFVLTDINNDGVLDIRVRWSLSELVNDGNLDCETARVQIVGRDSGGQEFRGLHEVEVIDCPGITACSWNNGERIPGTLRLGLVTHPGAGAGGADVSMASVEGGVSTAGSNVQLSGAGPHFRIADDFVVPAGGCTLTEVVTHGYQTGAATPTWTSMNLNIWDHAPPFSGPPVASAVSSVRAWTGIYRVFNGAANIGNTDRPVHRVVFTFAPLDLSAGTYWIDWQVVGGASGWQPFVMLPPSTPGGIDTQTVLQNGQQMFNSAGAWQPILQAPGAEVPFLVRGPGAPPLSQHGSPLGSFRAPQQPDGYADRVTDSTQ